MTKFRNCIAVLAIFVVIFSLSVVHGAPSQSQSQTTVQKITDENKFDAKFTPGPVRQSRTLSTLFNTLSNMDWLPNLRSLFNMQSSGSQISFVPLGTLLMDTMRASSSSSSNSNTNSG